MSMQICSSLLSEIAFEQQLVFKVRESLVNVNGCTYSSSSFVDNENVTSAHSAAGDDVTFVVNTNY